MDIEWILLITSIVVLIFVIILKKSEKPKDVEKAKEQNAKSNLREDLEKRIKANAQNELSKINQHILDLKTITLEERLKTAIPCKEGLYPHEILALNCAYGSPIYQDYVPDWWVSRYGIRNVREIFASLMERGFLKVGDIEGSLEGENINILKAVMQKYNLKTFGKKSDLIKRLIDGVPEDKLRKMYPQQIYGLTNIGRKVVEENEYIMFINARIFEDLDIWSLNILINTLPYDSYQNKIRQYLDGCGKKYLLNGDVKSYTKNRGSAVWLCSLNKKYDSCLEILSEIIFYDLNGHINYMLKSHKDQIKYVKIYPYEESLVKIQGGIIRNIFEYREKLKLSDLELECLIMRRIEKIETPFDLFTKEECIQILFWERDRNFSELNKVYYNADKKLNEYLRSNS